jgi:hypothetical protein
LTWGTFRTFAALWTLLALSTFTAWFTGLARLAGFLRRLLLRRVVVLSRWALFSVFCRTFFTRCAVATLAAVTAVAVA